MMVELLRGDLRIPSGLALGVAQRDRPPGVCLTGRSVSALLVGAGQRRGSLGWCR